MAEPVGGQIPYIGMTLEEIARRRQAYEMAKAALAERQSSLFSQYGLLPQFDASGKLTGVSQDPGNQTGAYQAIRRSEVDELEELEEAQAQRGFTGGLLEQDEDRLRLAHAMQDAQFMRDLMSQFGGIAGERQGLEFDLNQDIADIWKSAALQAIENRDFTPVTVPKKPAPKKKIKKIGAAKEARERIRKRPKRRRPVKKRPVKRRR